MTKEEAVSIIEERVRVTEYVGSSYVDCVDIEALRIAIKALEQPEQRWIPCDERMPYVVDGTSGAVLVTCGSKNVKDTSIRWVRRLWFDGEYWNTVEGERYNHIVYAWMSQPKPYKEGEKNETD